jgi:hypothetical protein
VQKLEVTGCLSRLKLELSAEVGGHWSVELIETATEFVAEIGGHGSLLIVRKRLSLREF